jgi:hypothetical protein
MVLKALLQRDIMQTQVLQEAQGMMQLVPVVPLVVLSWPVQLVWSYCFEEFNDDTRLQKERPDRCSTFNSTDP